MRVLVCVVGEAEVRLREALADHELVAVQDCDQALRALTLGRFDVVLVGSLFDESRGLFLMEKIQAVSDFRSTSVIGIRAKRLGGLPPEVFDLPMRALGARDVIDLAAIPDNDSGRAEIVRRLRAAAEDA